MPTCVPAAVPPIVACVRILMVSDVPLRPELGAGRPYFELARELRALGHDVDTFDRVAAFGEHELSSWRTRVAPPRFAKEAIRHVRANAAGYDVVDANQGNLPRSGRELGLNGLLVARSAGLFSFYRDFVRDARRRWPDRAPGSAIGQFVHRLRTERMFEAERRSFDCCDLAVFPNSEETAFVREHIRVGRPSVTLPLGLSAEQAQDLQSKARPAAERLAARQVVFIGSWSLRKGSADWGAIVTALRSRVRDARILFLGTGVSEAAVLRDLELASVEGIEVKPWFPADDLPRLLATPTVGALPSYVEAGPFSVLEMLGAGLPTVAYDAPGARALIPNADWLAPSGDTREFAHRLARLMSLDTREYEIASTEAIAATARYRWRDIAEQTISAYQDALSGLSR